jgi:hypothetical protein
MQRGMRSLLLGALAALCACSSSSNDGSGGASAENCEFSTTIDTIACRVIPAPDQFSGPTYVIDVSGTAKGAERTESAPLEFYVKADRSNNITVTCASWSNYAAGTCVTKATEPLETNWTGTITDYPSSDEPSHEYTVTATTAKTFSTRCQNQTDAVKTVTCSH